MGKIEIDADFGFYWYILNRGVMSHRAICGSGFENNKYQAKRAIRKWFKTRTGLKNRIGRLKFI